MRAFLGYRDVADHQHGVSVADELICSNQQFFLLSFPKIRSGSFAL
jgi:hypothetical protein